MIDLSTDYLCELKSLVSCKQEDISWYGRLEVNCSQLLKKCQSVLFSDVTEIALNRYLRFHLDGINQLAAQLTAETSSTYQLAVEKLEELAAELTTWLGQYTAANDLTLIPPPGRVQKLNNLFRNLRNCPNTARLHPAYQKWLSTFASDAELETSNRITLRALDYLESLGATLNLLVQDHKLNNSGLESCLLNHNVNDLSYYAAWSLVTQEKLEQLSLNSRLEFLVNLQLATAVCPEKTGAVYHPDWPSLRQLKTGWLKEQLAHHQRSAARDHQQKPDTSKLPLNLSVAQLACLIYLLRADNHFPSDGLRDTFRFFAAHFSTKKQQHISSGSLSKEFYSISQVTAAVTRSILQDMINRINKEFFPA